MAGVEEPARLAAVVLRVAMASGKGVYAQAASSSSGGDPAPGWSAADALQQAAAHRAHQPRLQDDNDFAFTDCDQVVGLAGHHVPDAWLQVRSEAEQSLLKIAAGARVIDHPKQTISRRKGRTVSTPPKTDEATQRSKTLVSLFMDLGSFKPAGILTESVKADWKSTCTRLPET
eukprot:s367_g12.t1